MYHVATRRSADQPGEVSGCGRRSASHAVHRPSLDVRPFGTGGAIGIVAGMSRLRRTMLALGVTGVVSLVLRLRGTGGVPPQGGGWRELTDAELR